MGTTHLYGYYGKWPSNKNFNFAEELQGNLFQGEAERGTNVGECGVTKMTLVGRKKGTFLFQFPTTSFLGPNISGKNGCM